ncbi:Hypothetical_protein [Hexamita inflata]|uniref:Hypothetical_protein n=1 Tax=Hexamita inflata TaxID=28002 RepID=A0AA86QER3_9EUKA|nr:Hypothetical protein HINF_LOCUS43136 [Hexamita inflata]
MLPIISIISFQVFSAADFEFCYNFVFETPFQETLVINEVISFDNPATREACKQTTNVLFKETTKPIIQLRITGQVHINQAFSLFHYIYSDIVIQDTKLDLILIDGTNADVSIVNQAVSEYKIEIFQSNISISSSLALNFFMLLNTEIDFLINRSQIQYTLSGTVSKFYGISKELFGSKIENTTFDYQVTPLQRAGPWSKPRSEHLHSRTQHSQEFCQELMSTASLTKLNQQFQQIRSFSNSL